MATDPLDYETSCACFSWDTIQQELSGLPGRRNINIAYESVDRHAESSRSTHTAIRWIDKQGSAHDYSYQDLQSLTNRFANVLGKLNIKRGDSVFVLTGKIPELYISALGTLKYGAIFCPLFTVFGPEPIKTRLTLGNAKLLVTTQSLYEAKIHSLREQLPVLEHVLIVDEDRQGVDFPDTQNYGQLLEQAAEEYQILPTDPEDLALLHFTSGTTGKPKGVLHVHHAVVAHFATAKYALDLHPSDIFWCTADPGWVTGTSYGIIAPLAVGATLLVDSQAFSPERWYRILQDHQVTVWYTAPTAVRIMMKFGAELVTSYDTRSLRFIASVGEPLNPEAVSWGLQCFGKPIHDNWWQTETGSIMIANCPALPIKPGSMGRPVPGISAAVVRRIEAGGLEIIKQPGVKGELALQSGWPSMFRSYLNDPGHYQQCFQDGWYLTGDIVTQDEDGYFWFIGRSDDVIQTSGHLVGPTEVERVLLAHPEVAEVAVIGKPDAVAMEIVKAFVQLKPGSIESDSLRRDLLALGRIHLGAVIAPKELEFCHHIPKTHSGKILRRLLKARELNLPEGDTTTLVRHNTEGSDNDSANNKHRYSGGITGSSS